MKKIISITFAVVLLLSMTSCTKKLNVSDSELKGDAKGYFTIVDKPYKVVGDKQKKVIVEFERTAESLPENVSGIELKLVLEYLDKDGDIICKTTSSGSETKELLKLAEGDVSSVSFPFKDDASKATQIRVSSVCSRQNVVGWLGDFFNDIDDDGDADELDAVVNATGSLIDAGVEMIKALDDESDDDTKEELEKAASATKSALNVMKSLGDALK